MPKLVAMLWVTIVVVAGCARPAATTPAATAPAAIAPAEPGGLPARVERGEPVSREDAVRLAKEYLRTAHPEIVVTDQPPTAEYLEKSPIDSQPLWVVGFVASMPKDARGFAPVYSQSVFVRRDRSVVLGPAAASS
jgi:hypothetical protein